MSTWALCSARPRRTAALTLTTCATQMRAVSCAGGAVERRSPPGLPPTLYRSTVTLTLALAHPHLDTNVRSRPSPSPTPIRRAGRLRQGWWQPHAFRQPRAGGKRRQQLRRAPPRRSNRRTHTTHAPWALALAASHEPVAVATAPPHRRAAAPPRWPCALLRCSRAPAERGPR